MSDKLVGYVGTYTKGESDGIYSFVLDTKEGRLSEVNLAAKLENPTYLCLSEDHKFLYSVIKEEENGGVAAFSLDPSTDKLHFIDSELSPGSPPCHVSLDRDGRYLFSANYHKGMVEAYGIKSEGGAMTTVLYVAQHTGSGPDPRQEKAHTHFAGSTPDNAYVVAVELGCDLLFTYKIGEEGQLTEVSRLSLPAGSGPRHLAFHPKNQSRAYIMTEFSSEVLVLSYDASAASFMFLQAVKTIPETFTENSQGSAIHLSSDGRFVYAGNRGHNSICVLKVDQESGGLEVVQRVSTEGDWPRDFTLDPTERFLIASNQNTGNLVLFERNQDTGMLRTLQNDIRVPDPVCVKF